MKKRISVTMIGLLLLLSCQSTKKDFYNIDSVASPKGTDLFQPNWDNIAEYYQFPEWYVDAKFGIFIHWGVFTVPAFDNEWYSRNMYQKDHKVYKHHIETWGPHDKFGYKDFIPLFKAEQFNAQQWAELFKKSGAKYVVPVAEHHDGFSMYNSSLNEWNAVKMGPKKDVIGLLKNAVEKEGLIFGLSSHRAENAWFFNGGMEFASDVQDMDISLYGRRYDDQSYTEDFAREWLTHAYELVNKYEPKLFYFDWTVNNPVLMPYFNKFMAYYYNNAIDWGQGVVVNTKQGYPTNIHVWDVERGKSGKMMLFPWQTDTSIGKRSWSHIEGEEYKTPQQIVHDLVDIVSKNGNLLLNIGPRADGIIPDEQKNILLSIGEWLKVNGEAIYGTRPWKKFGEGETEPAKGSFSDNEATPYTARDIRFTTKGNVFYAVVLDWDDEGVLIKSLNQETMGDAVIVDINLLGSDERINWETTDMGLKISFPENKPCKYAYSFKITFDKKVGEHLESEAVNEVMKHGA
ncbi:alpha-L-fucosidase [Proteiniphilum sp. X52]|uniref:alpha-L-fucosidase n=1 Tax=Proteiniphilum sp. X52 TaxID=2382159 RepID=UPI002101A3CE|nr:alpha-L-fucosidase [Proteiniphilum sp. X52]